MQRGGITHKVRITIENIPIANLAALNELDFAQDTIEVPGLNRVSLIYTGTVKMPEAEITIIIKRGADSYKVLKNFAESGEHHDINILYTDKTGNPLNAWKWETLTNCELGPETLPAYEAGAEDVVKVIFKAAPDDRQSRTL